MTACSLFGQVKEDTIYSSDTMIVRIYKKNGKLNWEDNYVKGKLVSVKFWYYDKDVYGYFLETKTKDKPKIRYRKEFYLDGKLKVEGAEIKGKKDGKYKTYYSNGKMQCDCNFKNGERDSIQIIHFDSGQVSFIGNGSLQSGKM